MNKKNIYNEVLDNYLLRFFNSIINMNETQHPDPLSYADIERLAWKNSELRII